MKATIKATWDPYNAEETLFSLNNMGSLHRIERLDFLADLVNWATDAYEKELAGNK